MGIEGMLFNIRKYNCTYEKRAQFFINCGYAPNRGTKKKNRIICIIG